MTKKSDLQQEMEYYIDLYRQGYIDEELLEYALDEARQSDTVRESDGGSR